MDSPKLTDIASRAGVSTAAVSIALNNPHSKRVSESTRRQILRIAAELNYTPNALAKALAERRSRLLGLVVPLRDPIFFNSFIAQALSGIQSTLMRRGYNLLVFSPSGAPGRVTRTQILESRYTDGMLFINTRSCTAADVNATIAELSTAKVHFAMINSYYGRGHINYVGVDDAAIGEAAANYLTDHGHKRIAFLSGSAFLPGHIHLLRGLRRALRKQGLDLSEDFVGCTNYDQETAFSILDRWFTRRRTAPSAVFAADDQLLLYVYDYAESRGLSIPEDIAVLRRGNSGPDMHLRPKPASLVIPTFRMGELAAELLIDSIEVPDTQPQRVMLPFDLVSGATV